MNFLATGYRLLRSLLAFWAVMRTTPGQHDALNGSFAHQAGFTGAEINAVTELEEAFFAVGINIIRDGGAAQFDGLGQDFFDGFV